MVFTTELYHFFGLLQPSDLSSSAIPNVPSFFGGCFEIIGKLPYDVTATREASSRKSTRTVTTWSKWQPDTCSSPHQTPDRIDPYQNYKIAGQ